MTGKIYHLRPNRKHAKIIAKEVFNMLSAPQVGIGVFTMVFRAVLIAFVLHMAAFTLAADEKAKPASDQDDPIGRKLSERLGPYMQMHSLSAMKDAYRKDEKRQEWKAKYERLTLDEKIHYCIFQLRNESWYQDDGIWSDGPYSKEPEGTPTRELIKLGRPAIPQLIGALECRASTGMCWNRFTCETYFVQDVAFDAIDRIACRFFGNEMSDPQISGKDEKERQRLITKVHGWWEKNKGSDEAQWAKDSLFSEKRAGGASWGLAIDSLYRRLGNDSYPFLAKACLRLPKGREDADTFDETRSLKVEILQFLLKAPTKDEKAVFVNAVHDAPLWIRIDGAEGLWAIGDSSGLEAMLKENELLKDAIQTGR